MRVLFINTFDLHGGAAIAANRLEHVLNVDFDVQCFFLVGNKTSLNSNTFQVKRSKAVRIIEKLILIFTNKLGLQYLFLPFSTNYILRKVKELKPDIISLHNTHGGYFQTSLISKISKIAPVVWTLHDMWSFTGNSAHTFGDESWKELRNSKHLTKIYPLIGVNTGSALLKYKLRVYKKSNLTIVTPSKWLAKLAQQSPVFYNKRIVQIYNGLDINIFKPLDKSSIRQSYGLPVDATVLMFSAEMLKGNVWKGNDLFRILSQVDALINFKIHIVLVGKGEMSLLSELSNFIVHQTGYVNGEYEMAKYYSASDLFIYPTKADNLPNVLLESIACGTPCVTFNIGGCSEIILNDYNGVVVEPFNFEIMADAIIKLVQNPENLRKLSFQTREYALSKFSSKLMGEKYFDLFNDTLKKSKNN